MNPHAKAKLLIFKRNLNVDMDAEAQCKYEMKQRENHHPVDLLL